MSRGDGEHSFGHGEFCHWCGLRDDDPELEKPCDERATQKPSDATMAAYSARNDVADQIAAIAQIEYGITESLTWDEMIARIQALRPSQPAVDKGKEPR